VIISPLSSTSEQTTSARAGVNRDRPKPNSASVAGEASHSRRGDGHPRGHVRRGRQRGGEATAAQRLRDTDRARGAYVRHFYPGRRWEDPVHYHLWLDPTALSLDACTELIVAPARARFGIPAADPAAGATPSPHRV
jgi:hypothetical protein